MTEESQVPGGLTPIIDMQLEPTQPVQVEQPFSAERRFLAIKLFDFYKVWEPELTVSEQEHKTVQEEEAAPLAEDLINNALLEIRGAIVEEALPGGVYAWATDQMSAIERSVLEKKRLAQSDVQRVVTFLKDFLFKLYPEKESIDEIEDELAHGEDLDIDTGGLYGVTEEEERREIIRPHVLALYKLRYKWGFYPETTKGMPHAKRSAIRDELQKKYYDPSLNADENLDRIFDKKDASPDEVMLYEIARNKIAGNWLGGVVPITETLTALGNTFIEINEEMEGVKRRLETIKNMIEAWAKKGGLESLDEIDSLLQQAEIEIDKADTLIDRIFIALYREEVTDNESTVSKEKLEEVLEIKKT